MHAYDSTTIEHEGHSITVSWHYDEGLREPWKENDGHGPVSEWTTRDKQAGELVLCKDGRSKRFYDFAEACRIAKRDGWDSQPFNKGQESKRQQAAKAARADFEYLRAWCNDEWHWSYYTVTIEGMDYDESCGGIESDSQAEIEQEALADAKAWLEQELAESEAMAARDILTA